MKPEHLNIYDKKFLINRLIQQAPTGTLVREFFKNAEENAALAPAGRRLVRVYPKLVTGVRKLAFWNTGIGMNDEELRRATDLSSSINKDMTLDGNFGIGAKVSGLTMSKEGIRYRSCKDGEVHEVTIGYDTDEETYVRFPVQLPDGSNETVYNVTQTVLDEGLDLSDDWTEVVLYGESPDHDTVSEPLGKNRPRVDRSYVATTIFRRFESFSEGVEVRVDVAMTKGGGKDETGTFRQLKTLNEVLKSLPRHQTIYDEGSDLSIRYIHDPKHKSYGHGLSAVANPATGSTTFCAIVYKGERYDFKTKKAWSSAAPNFGIPFGSKVLTVEILIPDYLALPNQYRDGLTWPSDRSAMVAEDFADYVRELMPDWVKAVVQAESPEANENLDDLQKDLQGLLDEFRVPTTTRTSSRNPNADPSIMKEEGEQTTEPTSLYDDGTPGVDKIEATKPNVEPHVLKRAKKDRIRKAPLGAKPSKSSIALERAPEIKILTDPEEIAEKSLQGRAGCFYKDVQTLFINGLYSVVERMATELEKELRNEADTEIVRKVALRASRRWMAFRVGKATCYAISKKLVDDWNQDDLEKATSPESLTMAADDYRQSLTKAKRWSVQHIKAELLAKTEAA